MAKENSLGSWIDPKRLEELLEHVRPGSLERPGAPSDVDIDAIAAAGSQKELEEGSQTAPIAEDTLLPDEIPMQAFVKGLRPKLPPPEPSPQDEVEALEEEVALEPEPEPEDVSTKAPAPAPASASNDDHPREINPLNLYFHSAAPTPEARAEAFVSWVRETAGASSAFVVDAYGATIAAEPETDSVFLASLSNLADALGRGRDHFSRPEQSALHLEMEEGRVLCVVQSKWEVATVALGLIRERPLTRAMAIRYREELAKLIQKPRRRPRD